MASSKPDSIAGQVRPEMASLGAYSAHKSPDTLANAIPPESIIKLDANENPYGCSPRVSRALAEYGRWHIYPDAGQTKLRQQLAAYSGIDAQNIVAATGSGELLDDILCLFLKPGDAVLDCTPTFDLYRMRTIINRGQSVAVPRDDNFAVSTGAVKASITPRTKLIILANPNNPTGNLTPPDDIRELAETGVPLLIDEAYYEFCGETAVPLMAEYPNLMILRTFSKWAGLAGIRVGYGFFPLEIAGYLLKTKLPYNVNVAALVAINESLKDTAYLQGNIQAIISERERLYNQLQGIEYLKPFSSKANYILCAVKNDRAPELHRKLQDRGILIRYFNKPRLEGCIRISVGRPQDTVTLISVLKELGKELYG